MIHFVSWDYDNVNNDDEEEEEEDEVRVDSDI